jgi:hypothetical protein
MDGPGGGGSLLASSPEPLSKERQEMRIPDCPPSATTGNHHNRQALEEIYNRLPLNS